MNPLAHRCIVVPVDFSAVSLDAVKTAGEMADDETTVHLVHVLPIIPPMEGWGAREERARQQACERTLAAAADRLDHGKTVAKVIVAGAHSPAPDLVHYAKSVDAGLIIMPSRGRTGLTRLLIGSVAERVVRLADIPVLVLPT